MKTSSEAAAAVYLSLQNACAQRDALSSAASFVLNYKELRAFNAVMAFHKTLSGDRNDLAHGIFGFDENQPDWLLWHPSAKHAAWLTEVYRMDANKDFGTDRHLRLREELFVYTKSDLEKVLADFTELWSACFDFHVYLKSDGHPQKSSMFDHLYSLPRIRAELDRMDLHSSP